MTQTLAAAHFLIADPFLKDDNFMRSVVFLCSHDATGSFGLTIHKKLGFHLSDLMDEISNTDIPVFVGGPVATDTLHFLHQYPSLIPNAQSLGNGIYWGGDFAAVTKLINNNEIDLNKIKFFLGYSGWSAGQLEGECHEHSWLIDEATASILFTVEPEKTWEACIRKLGGDYLQLLLYPIDPQLN
jgi:putative transcriptional regulator